MKSVRARAAKPTQKSPKAQSPALGVVILAAGQGKRMKSSRAKVLHELAGVPLLNHVLEAVAPLKAERTVVVVGHQAEAVQSILPDGAVTAVQKEQLGTGHAVAQAKKALAGLRGEVLVLCGDVPLIRTATIKALLRRHRATKSLATVLSVVVDDPSGYGRVVREDDGGLSIVEHGDASPSQRLINEINSGTYCFDAEFLARALGSLGRNNAQNEYYLTDLMALASAKGRAECVEADDESELLGINSRVDLAIAQSLLQDRLLTDALEAGVTFLDPSTVWLGARVKIGRDTVVGPGVRLDGNTRIGKGCQLDGSSYLRDTKIADNVLLRWGVVADGATVAADTKIGPFAHLRPQAELASDVHIGNFVEVKKSRIGKGSKANHLAYIGDSTVGRNVNIGAGTITCNYDGVNKHQTVIGDGVQIGSDTQLVAPVSIGRGAYLAAGSTITRDVTADSLAFNDKPQRERKGWAKNFRARNVKKAGSGKKG